MADAARIPGAGRESAMVDHAAGMLNLTRFAWLSIAAAIATITLKTGAFLLTGSVSLLSDALESLVNLAAALVALWTLVIAVRPADEEHAYGHGKVEYFASGFEGSLIILAALTIAWKAFGRLVDPRPLEAVSLGLIVSAAATLINFATARVLTRAGREYGSITLLADSRHLMTDVWTSVGVIAGVALTEATGWLRLDPIIALFVAANIVISGTQLLFHSATGLMDSALPGQEKAAIETVLMRYRGEQIGFHALRTRQAGARRFISLHILVPGDWPVKRAHDLAERVEEDLRAAVPRSHVSTHIEPREDPAAYQDIDLDR